MYSIEKAIMNRLSNPECYEQYHSSKYREYPYYRIYVKNFEIYYVIIDNKDTSKVMEVRRILYSKSDKTKLI